ncbi:pilus (MSHA type) biogenesis protein MshL [Halorhodospira halophila]|uniref:pilus (MSHA type) biogenesis protein MshL n=1 Tax=Halorhodospira halophila TaxID=1053 RepID=UPI001912A824|nr:pilus (MSHA type) biogenesis protein MshL [Halorhodospira halophila]MBK5942650.1 hypothetical protein [Halorhodospira halophila]
MKAALGVVRLRLWLGLAGAAVLLGACASPGERAQERSDRAAEQLAPTEPDGQVREDDSVASTQALEEALGAPGLGDPLELQPEDPRFDIIADGVDAGAFFHGLVEDTPYNVVVHPEVEGELSLTLRDVSVPEVMDTVREIYGYEYKQARTGFLILPARPRAEVFHLDYLNVHRSGHSGTRVTSGEITSDDGGDGVIGSRVDTSSNSDLWGQIEETVTRMIEDDETASVVASPAAGTLAVRGMPESLRRVEEFVDRLQASLNRQVILEARILEVELGDDFQAGISWESIGRQDGRPLEGSFRPGDNLELSQAGVFSIGITRGVDGQRGFFEGFLRALEQQGDVQVLSTPQVSTLNNQKAVIKAGTDSFFQTDLSINYRSFTDGAGNQTVQPELDPDFEPFFSGIALDVTPQIEESGWINLHVQPSVTEVRERERTLRTGRGDDEVRFSLAESDVRQSDSIVRARSGEMIVIGGLIEEREEQETSRVPLLGRIPLLGWLFTQERQTSSKYELVILLRPRVVGADTWAGELEEHSQRIQGLYDRY